jgi:hypothetical protein
MTDTQAPEDPRPPDIGRRTLSPLGYVVVAVVPLLVAALGVLVVYLNHDPEDVVTGTRVPIMTSDWRAGDDGAAALIEGELTLGSDDCVHLVAPDGGQIEVVWPFDYEATVDPGRQLKLYDINRKVVARGGDQVRMGGAYQDVGGYAGRPCAPESGEVAFVQSEVVVTAR